MQAQYQAIIPAPFGFLGITTSADYLTGSSLILDKNTKIKLPTDAFCRGVVAQINAYFANSKHIFNIPVALNGTPFQKRVWSAIQQVSAGSVISYSDLAVATNSGPRAVANACGSNSLLLVIPCHRIVAKNGLGGFGGREANISDGRCEANLNVKRWLLSHEQAL